MKTLAAFQEVYSDWIGSGASVPEIQPEGYPFQAERDADSPTRHRMNLLCSTACQADTLVEWGHKAEARRPLLDAALLEPRAHFIQDRIESLR